jgi:hypothetical protein
MYTSLASFFLGIFSLYCFRNSYDIDTMKLVAGSFFGIWILSFIAASILSAITSGLPMEDIDGNECYYNDKDIEMETDEDEENRKKLEKIIHNIGSTRKSDTYVLYGDLNHYDEQGHYIGSTRKSDTYVLYGDLNHYDEQGHYIGSTRKSDTYELYGDLVHYDKYGHQI